MARRTFLVGNWKMNQGLAEIEQFFEVFEQKHSDVFLGLAPQAPHLTHCLSLARARGDQVAIGAQNCAHCSHGAYTGEVSPAALKELGASFTLVGHSERRTLFGETHALLRDKVQVALAQGLMVVFCVGETLEQRESGATWSTLEGQLTQGLEGLALTPQQLAVAYEPVWAIGTGRTASPDMANQVHAFIRRALSRNLGVDGDEFSLLYGGSVKPDNIKSLLAEPHIDGALVGGASLKAADFQALAQVARAVSGGGS